jgi:glucokinase
MASGSNRYWVGFDLGGTKIMASVFDAQFRLRGMRRKKTKGEKGQEAALKRMAETIEEAMEKAGIARNSVAGIGVGSAGPLDLNRGMILHAPNLGWTHVPLKDALEKRFRCPVVVANDVDAGTYGEYRFGAARGARCVVGVFPGTGIGGACVYEGRIIRGRVNSCMEIGHMVVNPNGNLCGCGRRGCLETVASRLAIAAEAATAAARGQAPHLLKIAGTDVRQIKSAAIAAAIKAGDRWIEDIVRRAARELGRAVANVINLLAPDVVVLGGGLVEEMPGLILDESQASAKKWAMPSLGEPVKFVVGKLWDQATALGAAALAAEEAQKRR